MTNLLRLASLALCLTATACHSGPDQDTLLLGFVADDEGAALGSLPTDMHVAETNGVGRTATWAVAEGGANGGGHCVRITEATNRGDTFNLLISDIAFVADLRIDVAVRADSGEEDQGGGVFWRAQGPDDYYVTRWNPLEDNLRIYKVERGVRTQLQSAKITVEPGLWHQLSVTMDGAVAKVSFDGAPMLEIRDETFKGPGYFGLWTKADAASSFDDLKVSNLRIPD